MNYSDIKPGEVFTIDNIPAYPKLRTTTGYIDMVYKTVIVCEQVHLHINLRLLTLEEISKAKGGAITERQLNEWKQKLARMCDVRIIGFYESWPEDPRRK